MNSNAGNKSNGRWSRPPPICLNCGLKGHFARDCHRPSTGRPGTFAEGQNTKRVFEVVVIPTDQDLWDKGDYPLLVEESSMGLSRVFLNEKNLGGGGQISDGVKLPQHEVKILLPLTNEVLVCFDEDTFIIAVFDSGAEISVVDPSCLTYVKIDQNECEEIIIRSAFGEKLWVKTVNIPCRLFSAPENCPMAMMQSHLF